MPQFESVKNKFRQFGIVAFVTFAVLVAIRAILPQIALRIVNFELAKNLGAYTGHLDDLDFSLYRGAYQLQGLEIKKIKSAQAPLFTFHEMELSLSWRALFHGAIAADVSLDQPTLRLVDSDRAEEKQFGTEEKGWRGALHVLVPIRIQNLKVSNGAVEFSNPGIENEKPVSMHDITLHARNLITRPRNSAQALSPFDISAVVQNQAKLWAAGQIDALAAKPRLNADFSFIGFQIKSVNRELLTYVPLDFTGGRVDLYGEAALIKDGPAEGYLKIFFSDVDVVATHQVFKSFKHFGFEIISAIGNWFLENKKSERVAAKVPFRSDGMKWDFDFKDAFWSAVKNKQEPLNPRIDNSISLKSVM